jgi:hypothetical protein
MLELDCFPVGDRRIQKGGFAFIESSKGVLDRLPIEIFDCLIATQELNRSGKSSRIRKETLRQFVHNHPPTSRAFSGDPSTAGLEGSAKEDLQGGTLLPNPQGKAVLEKKNSVPIEGRVGR